MGGGQAGSFWEGLAGEMAAGFWSVALEAPCQGEEVGKGRQKSHGAA